MSNENHVERDSLLRWIAGPVLLLSIAQIFALAPREDWFSPRVWIVHLFGTAIVVALLWIATMATRPILGRLFTEGERGRSTALGHIFASCGGFYGAEILSNKLGGVLPGLLLLIVLYAVLFFGYVALRRWGQALGHDLSTTKMLAVAGLFAPLLYHAARKTTLLPDEAADLKIPLILCTLLYGAALLGVTAKLRRPKTAYIALGILALIGLRLGTTNPHALRLGPSVNKAGAPGGPPIVLIVIDTGRADIVDLSDPKTSNTPALSALGRAGDVYTQTVANGSWTLPGHTSIFTGLSLSQHKTDLTTERGFYPQLASDIPVAQEIFAKRGYRTACITGNGLVGPHTKLARGFERYRHPGRAWMMQTLPVKIVTQLSPSTQSWLLFQLIADLFELNLNSVADEAVDYAIEEIERESDEPLYLFLNFMDVHQPYPSPDDMSFGQKMDFRWDLTKLLAGLSSLETVSKEHAETVRHYYEAQIPRLDGEIGRVFDALRAKGWYDDALIVVTADHGEAFWENLDAPNYFGHNGAYEPAVRIPLIIKPPGQTVGRVITDYAQQRDILPTMLGHLGVPVPERAAEATRTSIVTEWYPRLHGHDDLLPWKRVAVYSGRYKYVVDEQNGESLYDLEATPHESRDILAERPEIVDQLRIALLEELGADPSSTQSEGGELNEGLKDQLKSLGYL